MRVSAGKYKGRELYFPKNIRPSSQLHKKILFDTIRPYLPNSNFLDLFAGSGQIGIEALSQGSFHTTFVDNHKLSIKAINSNLTACHIEKINYQVIFSSIRNFVSKNKSKYDLIYADPPYQTVEWNDLTNISELMHPESIFILKYSPKNPPPDFKNLKLLQTKNSTDTNLNFYQLSSYPLKGTISFDKNQK